MKYDTTTDSEYTVRWFSNGVLHRIGGPAVEYSNGDKEYYVLGMRHNEELPAVVKRDVLMWYKCGQLHREDGPAVIYRRGIKMWYYEGVQRRDYGPIIDRWNGIQTWNICNKKETIYPKYRKVVDADGFCIPAPRMPIGDWLGTY